MFIISKSRSPKCFFNDLHTYTHTYIHTYIHTHIHTYLLTPRSRVLLEKLTGSAASQEIPCILWTRIFITALTSARHLSLSWARSIQSMPPYHTSWISILILSSHYRLVLTSGLFPSGFSIQTPSTSLPHMRYKPSPSHSSRFDHPNNFVWGLPIKNVIWMHF
jgi:hypothetical protein